MIINNLKIPSYKWLESVSVHQLTKDLITALKLNNAHFMHPDCTEISYIFKLNIFQGLTCGNENFK